MFKGLRICCDNVPYAKITYNGGIMGNDEILVCKKHIKQHPFNKQIIQRSFLNE